MGSEFCHVCECCESCESGKELLERDNSWICAQCFIDKQDDTIEDLESTIAKLPVYADTGKAFVHGVDECFICVPNSRTVLGISARNNGMHWFETDLHGKWRRKFYSTPDAAQRAADAAKGEG